MRIHDITRPVAAGMPVWPGDPPCRVQWAASVADDGVNVAELSLSTHTGTHADAPYHVLGAGARAGELPLDAFVGPTWVADAPAGEIGARWIEAHLPAGCERILFCTGAWTRDDAFPGEWPALTPEAAVLLASRGVRLVGTDAPSPDALGAADLPVHRVLLGAGVAIVENLLLDGIEPGEYELMALPLRLAEADASPVRAILVER